MRKTIYILAFISIFMMSTGIMFELFHWPFSGKMMFAGFLTFNFGFLPVFVYRQYKKQIW